MGFVVLKLPGRVSEAAAMVTPMAAAMAAVNAMATAAMTAVTASDSCVREFVSLMWRRGDNCVDNGGDSGRDVGRR